MERHLASGCRKCRRTAELLSKLAAAARNDSRVQVPQYALRCAQAIFVLQQPERVQILPRIPVRLLYDSFREPLPAGVRTQQRLSRQALYQAGDYSLDLQLEKERGSPRVALVGQNPEPQAARQAPGGHHMEYTPTKRLWLYVGVRQAGKRIDVRKTMRRSHAV